MHTGLLDVVGLVRNPSEHMDNLDIEVRLWQGAGQLVVLISINFLLAHTQVCSSAHWHFGWFVDSQLPPNQPSAFRV